LQQLKQATPSSIRKFYKAQGYRGEDKLEQLMVNIKKAQPLTQGWRRFVGWHDEGSSAGHASKKNWRSQSAATVAGFEFLNTRPATD